MMIVLKSFQKLFKNTSDTKEKKNEITKKLIIKNIFQKRVINFRFQKQKRRYISVRIFKMRDDFFSFLNSI